MGTGEAGQRVGDKVTGAVLEVPGHTPHSFRPRSGGGTGRPPDANSMVRVTMRKRQLAERIGRVVGTAARPGRRASVERTGTGLRFRAGSGRGRAGRRGRGTRAGEPEDPSRAGGSRLRGRGPRVGRRTPAPRGVGARRLGSGGFEASPRCRAPAPLPHALGCRRPAGGHRKRFALICTLLGCALACSYRGGSRRPVQPAEGELPWLEGVQDRNCWASCRPSSWAR